MKQFISFIILWSLATVCLSAEPITFIVPAGVGTTSDALARRIAQQLEIKIKQPVVIANAPGGDQLIGLNKVETTPGPVLVLGGTTLHVFNPVFKKLTKVDSELEVLNMIAYGPVIWYTNPKSNITNATELIGELKENKPANIGADMLSVRINADSIIKKYNLTRTQVIQYKASTQTLVDVASGTVNIGVSSPSPTMLALINSGKIIPLANTSKKSILLDNKLVPPMANYTPANQYNSGWFISTSKKNPVNDTVVVALNEVLQQEEIKKLVIELGAVYDYQTAKSANDYIKQYRKQLSELAKTGIVE